jgi:hypothetical protein
VTQAAQYDRERGEIFVENVCIDMSSFTTPGHEDFVPCHPTSPNKKTYPESAFFERVEAAGYELVVNGRVREFGTNYTATYPGHDAQFDCLPSHSEIVWDTFTDEKCKGKDCKVE